LGWKATESLRKYGKQKWRARESREGRTYAKAYERKREDIQEAIRLAKTRKSAGTG
jgi:hypothetical protein